MSPGMGMVVAGGEAMGELIGEASEWWHSAEVSRLYGLQTKSGPLPVFANKVLLEHSYTHCHGELWTAMAERNHCIRDLSVKLKIFTIWPFILKVWGKLGRSWNRRKWGKKKLVLDSNYWDLILAPSFHNYVTLGKLFNFYEPQFPNLYKVKRD